MKKIINFVVAKSKFLFPRDASFFELFKQMGELQEEIAFLFYEQVVKHGFGNEEYSHRAQVIEHKGDVINEQILDYLRNVFITPLDRDDIHRIAHKLDNVIDFIEDIMIRIEMYGLKKYTPAMIDFAELIKEASLNLSKVIHCMTVNDIAGLQSFKLEIHRLERKADNLRKNEITRLYQEFEDAKLIAQHEKVIERLEKVMDQYKEVVEIIDRIVVKSA